ncbi:glutamate-rich protein 2 isoform X3 [Coregonus clupeaformis]|uniref:glutamate-rich protein 2 isoform X3 n=1 Tax=Coregonus clupeaformis TaxID=59861 RepID=UPI001BDFF541|nr:glutamate-rich protein 2 isoform X3 [Coregonus clupeaformis]
MSRLECLGKSSKVPQKQVVPALLETHMLKEAVGAKSFTATPGSLPTQAVSNPVKVSPPGRLEVLCAGGVNNISVGFAGPPVVLSQDLKDNKKPQQSVLAVTGGRVFMQHRARTTPCSVCVPPPAEPLPPLAPEGEEENTEEDDGEEDDGEEDDDDEEGHRAPMELMAEFLKSVMEKDFVLAKKLCQMILIYEPNNPEAKQFIPLIQEKLEREQEEKSQDNDCSDSSDEDDSEDSESDQDSAQSSDSSSSSSSSDEEEEQRRRHKPCPPSHLSQ